MRRMTVWRKTFITRDLVYGSGGCGNHHAVEGGYYV